VTRFSQPLTLLARSAVLMNTSLDSATHVLPTRSTPCARWDLGTLISHVADSADLLIGSVGGRPRSSDDPDCRARARARIQQLLLALGGAPRDRADLRLTALTGAFELTIHAWDIAESTAGGVPLPDDLVSDLLTFAPIVLGNLDRAGLFDRPRPPRPGEDTDLDRLLALSGRQRRDAA
jgi:hypothetical protein